MKHLIGAYRRTRVFLEPLTGEFSMYLEGTNLKMKHGVRRFTRRKEPETTNWIQNVVKGTFYDIGANAGTYSILASQYANQVIAIEPNPFQFKLLCDNIRINKIDNIIPLNIAILGDTGLFDLPCPHKEGKTTNNRNSAFRLSRQSYSLDKLIDDFDLPYPDYMKVDCDSPMLDHLLSSPKTLNKLTSLLIEEPKPYTIIGFDRQDFKHPSGDINYIFTKHDL